MPKLVECYFQKVISLGELKKRVSAPRHPGVFESDENRVIAAIVKGIGAETSGPYGTDRQITFSRLFDSESLKELPPWVIRDDQVFLCLHRQFCNQSQPVRPDSPATDQVICGVTRTKACALRKKGHSHVS